MGVKPLMNTFQLELDSEQATFLCWLCTK